MMMAVWMVCGHTLGGIWLLRDTQRAGHVGPGEALQGQEEQFGQIEELYIIFSFNSL